VKNDVVLACCDKELIGRNLKEGNYDVTIEESFYRGELVDEHQLKKMIRDANSINLFGNKAIMVAKKQGLISDSDIIRIEGVEHAVILKV